ELLARARSVAESLPAEPRALALIGILPLLLADARLPELAGLLDEVTSAAGEEPPPWVLSPHIGQSTVDDRTDATVPLTDTGAAVTALPAGWARDYLVARLCPRLPDALLPQAVTRLCGLLAAGECDPTVPARALVALAPRLDEPLLARAWAVGVARARDL